MLRKSFASRKKVWVRRTRARNDGADVCSGIERVASIGLCTPIGPSPFGARITRTSWRATRAVRPTARTPGRNVPTNPAPGAHVNHPVAAVSCEPTGNGSQSHRRRARVPCSVRRCWPPRRASKRSISSPRRTGGSACSAAMPLPLRCRDPTSRRASTGVSARGAAPIALASAVLRPTPRPAARPSSALVPFDTVKNRLPMPSVAP